MRKFKHVTWGFLGSLGNGKTLGMSMFLRLAHLDGFQCHANYEVRGYPVKLIDSKFDLKNIDILIPKVFAMDELYNDLDSRESLSMNNKKFSKSFLQMRKRKISLFYSSQDDDQVEKRVRRLTTMFYFPYTHYDSDGYPLAVEFFYTKDRSFDAFDTQQIMKYPSFFLPVNLDGFDVAANYETEEVIEGLEDTENDELVEGLLSKYSGWDGKKNALVSKMVIEDKMGKPQASLMADYILSDS